MTRVLGGQPKKIVIIGGMDPSGASGVLTDLRALQDLPLWPEVVITALTEQRSRRVSPTPLPLLRATLQQALRSHPAAVKIGMIYDAAQAREILRALTHIRAPIVFDPVLTASSGLPLYHSPAKTLWPLIRCASLLTPNLPEAEELLGEQVDPTRGLLTKGARAVLLKDGHARRPNLRDEFRGSTKTHIFSAKRFPYEVRGTGCALASRIAGELAQSGKASERELIFAIGRAEKWLHSAYRRATEIR